MIRILHTADWQLGKPFGDIPGDAGAFLRQQRFKTVADIAALASERQVDAVLVAGDCFETNRVTDETLHKAVDAMQGYAGPWCLLPGNHDAALAESVWTRLHRMGVPDNIHLLTEPSPLLLADQRLAVLPAPLARRHEPTDITQALDTMDTPPQAARVGLAHGSVANRLPHSSEAANTIADDRAERAGLNYLALGDWHGTLEIAPRTWYAGTPEVDRFRANDPGNVLIVAVPGPGEAPAVERVATTHYRWHRLETRLGKVDDLTALEDRLRDLGQPAERRVMALKLTGSLPLSGREALDDLLARWRARLCHLRVDDSELLPEVTDADLDQLAAAGFVRQAVERLQHLQTEESEPERTYAGLALQTLYAEYQSLRSRS